MNVDRLTGQHIGDYLLGPLLGEGAMGSVYQAIALDDSSSTPVALKLLAAKYVDNTNIQQRFLREVKLLQALRHPHIVPILDYGVSDRTLFYTMPIVYGPNLKTELSRRHFSPLDSFHILLPVSQALQYGHDQGVVHRDIKPANILLGELPNGAYHVYLVDFGLAKRPTEDIDLTAAGISVGSPFYISPEAVAGREVDSRADLYSLGILLYQMLSGTLPFIRSNRNDVLKAHFCEAPPPLRAQHPDFPPTLEAVVLQALEKRPEQRHASVQALAYAYQDALRQLSPEQQNRSYWKVDYA